MVRCIRRAKSGAPFGWLPPLIPHRDGHARLRGDAAYLHHHGIALPACVPLGIARLICITPGYHHWAPGRRTAAGHGCVRQSSRRPLPAAAAGERLPVDRPRRGIHLATHRSATKRCNSPLLAGMSRPVHCGRPWLGRPAPALAETVRREQRRGHWSHGHGPGRAGLAWYWTNTCTYDPRTEYGDYGANLGWGRRYTVWARAVPPIMTWCPAQTGAHQAAGWVKLVPASAWPGPQPGTPRSLQTSARRHGLQDETGAVGPKH